MAEAIGIAASVIGIVGFAGQVLQGCQIVRTFLDDFKDAPAYIDDLKAILQAFQTSLTTLMSKYSDEAPGGEDLRLALEYSGKCIQSLQAIIDKLQRVSPGPKLSFAIVRWKSKIIKEVENLKMAMALLNSAQMNQVGTALDNVYGQLVQSQINTQGLYTLVKQTQRISLIPAPSWRQNYRRRPTKLASGESSSSKINRIRTSGPQKLQLGIEEDHTIPLSILDAKRELGPANSPLPKRDSTALAEFQKDRYFNFGSSDYLPSDYIEAVKDTIRGVLVEYFFQTRSPSGMEAITNINSPPSTVFQKQKGTIRTRGILSQEFEEQKFQRALGLVTVTRTTTKWRTSHMDSSYYIETRIQVYLDPAPQNDPPLRLRLFCISTFDGTPRYEPRFDPALRVSNRVRYNDPIVVACRNGDLDKVRMLFASGNASPYDCCEADINISLLDIVFKQLMLNLDAPAGPANYMAKLHILFKYLVNLGLDPGELNRQYRQPNPFVDTRCDRFYTLRCSYCFERIEGIYYDCKLCACGDFCLCQPCIEAGRRCQDPEHHEMQQLVDSRISRTMLGYKPLESLASIYYAKENAPYLVDVARTILCHSKQDPFEETYGGFFEWKRCEALTHIESPVLKLISHQQEWVFSVDQIEPENLSDIELSNIPLAWKPPDPVGLLLRAWTDLLASPENQSMVFEQLSYLLDNDDVHAEFYSRAATIINQNPSYISFLLWTNYMWPTRKLSLEILLPRCIETRLIKGFLIFLSKYYTTEEPPFPFDENFHCEEGDDKTYKCLLLTRRVAEGIATDIGDAHKLGFCLAKSPWISNELMIFYEGSYGAVWLWI
ncbi:hypothetical protein L207DRAFT_564508 [Hyaloscypha variabilis F]|uniref:Uncharacterized protein n=1 Tax=Hyaloscypha variabilis (strain UAMH 11265 / GT02V1 / F) TaxID=1149755 RepID=A0A2J6RUB0_HYAVF|nr:hypothetical protein L207DRAFT_564508 [Hyaloscypha variabilis F]